MDATGDPPAAGERVFARAGCGCSWRGCARTPCRRGALSQNPGRGTPMGRNRLRVGLGHAGAAEGRGESS